MEPNVAEETKDQSGASLLQLLQEQYNSGHSLSLETRFNELGVDDVYELLEINEVGNDTLFGNERTANVQDANQRALNLKSIENGEMKVFCILGSTGVGKSSIANTLTGSNGFKVSNDLKSETDTTHGRFVIMRGQGCEFPALVIDTPGYGDSEGRDSIHTANMILALKAVKNVNAFIVCLNSEDIRIDENKQGYLKLLAQIFGDEFYQHVMICYTKWSNDEKAMYLRDIGRRQTQANLIKRSQEEFQAKLGVKFDESQFSFIDNNCSIKGYDHSESEIKSFKEQIARIIAFSFSKASFSCNNIKAVEHENAEMRYEMLRQFKILELKRVALESKVEQQTREISLLKFNPAKVLYQHPQIYHERQKYNQYDNQNYLECTYCHRSNHNRAQCWDLHEDRYNKCMICGRDNHYAKDCYYK